MKVVIEMLIKTGWIADGATREEMVRVPTFKSPLLGRGGGELRTFGGRTRFLRPGTNRKVTVGIRTTVFYRVIDGQTREFVCLGTGNIEAITLEATA